MFGQFKLQYDNKQKKIRQSPGNEHLHDWSLIFQFSHLASSKNWKDSIQKIFFLVFSSCFSLNRLKQVETIFFSF